MDYAALSREQRDSVENKDLEAALNVYDFGSDVSNLLWLSSTPDVFLFRPAFRDIIIAEGIYFAANQYNRNGVVNLNKQWPSLPLPVFRQLIDSIADGGMSNGSVLDRYRQWMQFHRADPGVQLFIESLARKYIYLVTDPDTADRRAYEQYLVQNLSSPHSEFKAHIVYQLCLLWNEDGNKYADFENRYDFLLSNSFDKKYQYMSKNALELYRQNEKLLDRFPVFSRVLELMQREIQKSGVRIEMQDVFMPGEAIPIRAMYKNTDTLFYRIANLQKNERYRAYPGVAAPALMNKRPVQAGSFLLPLPDDHNNHAVYLKLPALQSGRYCLIFGDREIKAGGRNIQSIAFLVTGIAAVNTDERVYVLDRKTGMPLGGATVKLFKSKGAKTGGGDLRVPADGHLFIPEEKADSLSIAYRDDTLGYKFTVNTNEPSEDVYDKDLDSNLADYYDDKLTMHIFTDRAIYRPGQTVHYKIIFLTKDPLTGTPILFNGHNVNGFLHNRLGRWLKENKGQITIKDPFNRTADSIKLAINEFGSFAGTFVIPKMAATGDWRIEGKPETQLPMAIAEKI